MVPGAGVGVRHYCHPPHPPSGERGLVSSGGSCPKIVVTPLWEAPVCGTRGSGRGNDLSNGRGSVPGAGMSAALPKVPAGRDRLWGTLGPTPVPGLGRGNTHRPGPGTGGGKRRAKPGSGERSARPSPGAGKSGGDRPDPALGLDLGGELCLLGGHRPGPELVPWVASPGLAGPGAGTPPPAQAPQRHRVHYSPQPCCCPRGLLDPWSSLSRWSLFGDIGNYLPRPLLI